MLHSIDRVLRVNAVKNSYGMVHNRRVPIRRATIETFCFDIVVLCCLTAFCIWCFGMLRPKGFGAVPAALWVGLLITALLCSGTIGLLEVTR
jgi:hypothetical protein